MAHERRRAALAALCVFAVALAATLLPASGFGSYPAGVGTGESPDTSPGGTTAPDNPRRNPPTQTTAPTTSDGTTTTETTTTPTETTTITETTVADGTHDSGPSVGPGFVSTVVAVLLGGGAVLLALGFWSGVLAVSGHAAGTLPFTITVGGRPLGELVGAIPTRTMSLVVGLSVSVPRLLDDAAALTGEVGSSLATAGQALARGTGDALRVGGRGLAATVTAIPRALAGLGLGASTLSGVASGVSLPSIGNRGRDGDESDPTPTESTDPESPAPPSVEEAWQAMTDRLRVRNPDARTPGEFARAAAERGYPDEAVRRLTDAFREVRYGGLSRGSRTEAARSALSELRKHWRGEK